MANIRSARSYRIDMPPFVRPTRDYSMILSGRALWAPFPCKLSRTLNTVEFNFSFIREMRRCLKPVASGRALGCDLPISRMSRIYRVDSPSKPCIFLRSAKCLKLLRRVMVFSVHNSLHAKRCCCLTTMNYIVFSVISALSTGCSYKRQFKCGRLK